MDKAVIRFEKGEPDRSMQFVVKAINNGTERVVFERTKDDLTKQQGIVNEIPIYGEIDSLRIDITAAKVPSNGGNAWPLIAEVELLQEQEKTLPTTNVALNKTVTSATPAEAGRAPANVVDGKTNTLWVSDGGRMPTDIKVDLGKDTDVTYTKVIFENPGLKFKIVVEAIDDEGNVSELMNLDKNYNGLAKEYILPIEKSIRYVRVRFTGTSDPNATPWPALAELEIYSSAKNVASKAEVTTNTGENMDAIHDNDPTTGVTLQGAGEKTIDFAFDKAYDLNAYELIKSSILRAQGPAKYKISYANGNDDYKVISDKTGNTTDKDRLLDEFNKTIFADRVRFTFINDEITIQEIKLYEANVSKPLEDYITSVEKQLAKITIGGFAGNYTKEAKDIVDAAVVQAYAALEAGVNSEQVVEEINTLQKALFLFYQTGYVVIDRNPIKVELDKAEQLESALRDFSFEEQANELATSIAAARLVHDTYKVTQTDIQAAVDALALKNEEVLSTLTIVQQFDVLARVVEETLAQAVVGDKDNQVAQVDKDVLSNALAIAKTEIVKGNDEAKRGVVATLQAALDTFHTKRVVINRDTLRKTITQFETIEEKLYDKTQWNDFVVALAQAKELVDADVNQASMDAGLAVLEAAQQKLVLLDRSALQAAIATYESLQKELYTEESWSAFEKTLQRVTQLVNATSLSQKEVEEGVQSLKDAANALVKVLDKKGLEQAIATAKALQREDYTIATWQNMQVALNLAQDALVNATTQTAIDQAYATLLATIDQLEKVEQSGGGNGTGGNGTGGDDSGTGSGSGSGSETDGTTGGSGSSDNGDVTPPTGDTTKTGMFLGSMLLAGGAVVLLRKKAKHKA